MAIILSYKNIYLKDLNKLYCMYHNIKIDYSNKINVKNYILNFNKLKINLLKVGNKNIGYIVYRNPFMFEGVDIVNINEIYIQKGYDTSLNYMSLIKSANRGFIFKRFKQAYIYSDYQSQKFELASKLDIYLKKTLIEMKIYLNNYIFCPTQKDIDFILLKKGVDECKRVKIQNSIFKNSDSHMDCDLKDILYEENQDYYLENSCIFLKFANKIVGYSQVILERFPYCKPYIVNFGIDENYRHRGFAKLLLEYTINLIKQNGYSEAYIKVDSVNYEAYNLYKICGFKKSNTINCYQYKY